MNIMLNFIPLLTGGGAQVGLDFISNILENGKKHNWHLVARKNSPFENVSKAMGLSSIKIIPNDYMSRAIWEYYSCRKYVKDLEIDVIYTQFGPHWPVAGAKNIVGCAYSNLFYPELDFWSALPLQSRISRKIKDKLRLNRLLSADVQIFETEDLANRAINQFELIDKNVFVVQPAVSSLVAKYKPTNHFLNKVGRSDKFKVLLLSGYHTNKNFDFVIDAARYLQKINCNYFSFVFTLDEKKPEVKKMLKNIDDDNLGDLIINVGNVPFDLCSELYSICDATILPSKLESFSNTIAESWAMRKPLMISNLSWCKSICGQGAVYFEYLNTISLCEKMKLLREDKDYRNYVVDAGENRLSEFPTSSERFVKYLEIIESV